MIDLTKIPKKYITWAWWDIIGKKALQHDIDPLVIASVIQVESSAIPTLVRFEENYKWVLDPKELSLQWKVTAKTANVLQKCSFGLMQVMGAVFVEHGGNNLTPYNQPTIMLLPDFGIEFGCRHWNKFKKKYSDPMQIYACYNAGSLRMKEGIYENHEAVLRFKRVYDEFKTEFQT
jgi:soluble lytic murein transglycosylase-like protein